MAGDAVGDYDLVIESTPSGGRFRLSGSSGLLVEALSSLLPGPELRERCNRLCEYPDRPLPEEVVTRVGEELGRLLPPAIVEGLAAIGGGVPRLRLAVEGRALDGLPWEYARLPAAAPPLGAEAQSRALGSRFRLLRVACEAPAGPVPAVNADPLRMLIVTSDPATAAHPRLAHLRTEMDAVREAVRLAPGVRVDLEVLPYATRAGLQSALAERRPHLLHFIGHGEMRPSGGVLVLHGERPGAASAVYAEELCEWVRGGELRLAVLSACLSGGARGSVGERLARDGVPAVLAMQMPLGDASAARLARAFYASLLDGRGVDDAVEEGRQALAASGPDWGVPLLYLQPQANQLFRFPISAAVPPPVHLPYAPNPDFVGRDELLAALHGALLGERRAAALVGMGGAGKSQAAAEYAHRHLASYPSGAYWLNARDTQHLLEELAGLGGYFGAPENLATRERAEWVRQELQRLPRPALLVVDNVTEETDLRLLPATGPCSVLMTTRLGFLARPRFRAIPAQPLDEAAALELLRTGRVPQDEPDLTAAREVAGLVGHLPLALALIASHLRRVDQTYAQVRDRLQNPSGRFELLDRARRRFLPATEASTSIFDAIDLPYTGLGPDARLVLGAAAFSAGRALSPELLSCWCGDLEPARFDEALADLVDYSLVTRDAGRLLTVHELVRAYAGGRLTEPERRARLELAARASAERLEAANDTMEWQAVRRELAHFRALVEVRESDAAPCGELFPLLRELAVYEINHGAWDAADTFLKECARELEADGARPLDRAVLMRLTAQVRHLQQQRRPALLLFWSAWRLATEILDRNDPEMHDFVNGVAYVLKMQGKRRWALPFLQESLRLSERIHGPYSFHTSVCLNNLGTWHWADGDLEAALEYLERARESAVRAYHARHPLVAPPLNNIGRVLRAMGKADAGAARHQEALGIYLQTYGRRHLDVAYTLYFHGQADEALGRTEDASQRYREAAAVCETLPAGGGELLALLRARLTTLSAPQHAAGSGCSPADGP